MADETLGRMFWSRVERSGGPPAHMIKRKLVADKYAGLLESLYEGSAAATGSPRR